MVFNVSQVQYPRGGQANLDLGLGGALGERVVSVALLIKKLYDSLPRQNTVVCDGYFVGTTRKHLERRIFVNVEFVRKNSLRCNVDLPNHTLSEKRRWISGCLNG